MEECQRVIRAQGAEVEGLAGIKLETKIFMLQVIKDGVLELGLGLKGGV